MTLFSIDHVPLSTGQLVLIRRSFTNRLSAGIVRTRSRDRLLDYRFLNGAKIDGRYFGIYCCYPALFVAHCQK